MAAVARATVAVARAVVAVARAVVAVARAVVAVARAVVARGIMERRCTGMNSTQEQDQEWFPWGKAQDRSMHQESRNQRERQIGSISQSRSRTTRIHSAWTQY